MGSLKIGGVILIIAGILGLIYGSFTYPTDKHEGKLGPIEVTIKDNKTVNIPIWAGVVAIVLGGVLMFVGNRKS